MIWPSSSVSRYQPTMTTRSVSLTGGELDAEIDGVADLPAALVEQPVADDRLTGASKAATLADVVSRR